MKSYLVQNFMKSEGKLYWRFKFTFFLAEILKIDFQECNSTILHENKANLDLKTPKFSIPTKYNWIVHALQEKCTANSPTTTQ